MKKLNLIFAALMVLVLGSCGLISNLIPDIDTTFSKSFNINIDSPSGEEGPEMVDVTDSEDFEDFENNIDGFDVNDIKFQLNNYNGPDDMYFRGTLTAVSEDGNTTVEAGIIQEFLLSDYANDGIEHDVTEVLEGLEQIEEWLDAPGKFAVYISYELTDGTGNLYETEGMNYNLDLKIIYYVTVETGV
jgi:hypothetical protein